ncbi:UDP-N-acetylmuramoyl-tripeptide--D-alanyl-D-alanine ligase [Candidatus Woesebacteria bacterium]|nr:UDP-N-acetylmuramoyl-tripeptide--D-alanyl-D-alanine ligase [Candidatus Woesebacteria bacterium]
MLEAAYVLFALIYCFLLLVRFSRWLSLLQQKEYRWDRIITHLQTPEGLEDLVGVIPPLSQLSWSRFKRPRPTARVITSAFLVLCLILLGAGAASLWWLGLGLGYWTVIAAVFAILVLLFMPALVLVSAIPTSLISRWQTSRMLRKAEQLLARHAPLVIGITGSYGKTSTKQLLAHVLRQKYSVFATPKSFNTRFSVAQSVVEGYKNEEIVILEYGAYAPGEIRALASRLTPAWAIITGFAPQHLGLFGSEESIVKAKAELLQALPNHGKAFVNGNDPAVQRIVKAAHLPASLSFQKFAWEDYSWLKKAKMSNSGELFIQHQNRSVKTAFVGLHYRSIIAAVARVAEELKMSQLAVIKRLSTFEPSSAFITTRQTENGSFIIDDGGTSNPKGFAAALDLVSQLEYPKKILVTSGIVDLGEKTQSIHQELAQLAWQAGVSEVLFVGQQGKVAFTSVFTSARVIDDIVEVKTVLENLPAGSLLLIEGRQPGWCQKSIDAL